MVNPERSDQRDSFRHREYARRAVPSKGSVDGLDLLADRLYHLLFGRTTAGATEHLELEQRLVSTTAESGAQHAAITRRAVVESKFKAFLVPRVLCHRDQVIVDVLAGLDAV